MCFPASHPLFFWCCWTEHLCRFSGSRRSPENILLWCLLSSGSSVCACLSVLCGFYLKRVLFSSLHHICSTRSLSGIISCRDTCRRCTRDNALLRSCQIVFSKALFLLSAGDSSRREVECVCEGASCSSGSWCLGQQCFTSLSVRNGTSVLQKGCIADSEEESTRCRRPPTPELVLECCYGDLCNLNASLQLPAKGAPLVFFFL